VKAAGWLGGGSLVDRKNRKAVLRELYLDVGLGGADVRLGKQIIAWGRADALNPTDNLTRRDLTVLVPDDDDQKIGAPAVKVSLPVGGATVTAVWLAGFQGDELPLGAPPPGVRFAQRMPRDGAAQGALKVEQSGGKVDWSASYFTGFDVTPDIALRGGAADPTIELAHHRLHVVGADAATSTGGYGLRAEAAWIRTENSGGDDPEIKNSTLYAVAGADRTYDGYLNVNFQYVVRRVNGFTPRSTISDPARRDAALVLARISQQLRPVQQGATMRISNKWMHETLAAELAGIFLSPPWQLAIRPRLTYAATDDWSILLGGDVLNGGSETLFRELRKNSLAFLEVRRGL
jgi:hypothetical protein